MYYINDKKCLKCANYKSSFLKVKTRTDANIAFSAGETDSDVYEIVIGGWTNSQSVIRRGKQGRSLGSHAQVKKYLKLKISVIYHI